MNIRRLFRREKPLPPNPGQCCIVALTIHGREFYYLHRVRVHGEGAA